MKAPEFFLGLGLAIFGIVSYGFCLWYVRDDGRMRRMAESRWWLDRRTVRKLRTGEMSRDQWFARWARGQRAIVKWAFTPFFALWIALCVATVVHSFTGH
jgi:hypothetical protein